MPDARNRHQNDGEHHFGKDRDAVVKLSQDINPWIPHFPSVIGREILAGQSLHEYLVGLNEMVTDVEYGRPDLRLANAVLKGTIEAPSRFVFSPRYVPVESAQEATDGLNRYSFRPDGSQYEKFGNFASDGDWMGDSQNVAYGNGWWVMALDGGYVAYTRDPNAPASWSWQALWEQNDAIGSMYDVAYNGSIWVLVGQGLLTATDPSGTWTLRQTFGTGAGSGWRVAYGAGIWVVTNFSQNNYYTSPDGITWTGQAQPFGSGGYTNGIAFDGTTFVMTGGNSSTDALLATSTNGTSWTVRYTGAAGDEITSVAYGNGLWTAAGWSSAGTDVYTATSPTGTWTKRNILSSSLFAYPNAIVYGADGSFEGAGRWLVLTEIYDATNNFWTAQDPRTSTFVSVSNGHEIFIPEMAAGLYVSGTWCLLGYSNGDGPRVMVARTLGVRPTLDAFVAGRRTLDAVIKAAISSSLTANAVIKRTISSSFTADAVIVSPKFLADAVVLRTQAGSLTGGAVTKATTAGSLTADAFVAGRILTDAVFLRTQSSSATADAQIINMDTFDFNSFQSGAFE